MGGVLLWWDRGWWRDCLVEVGEAGQLYDRVTAILLIHRRGGYSSFKGNVAVAVRPAISLENITLCCSQWLCLFRPAHNTLHAMLRACSYGVYPRHDHRKTHVREICHYAKKRA